MECEPSMNGRNNQNKLYITVTLPCSHFPFGRGCATEKFAFVPPCISETRIQTLVEDSKNVRAVDTALDATSSGSPVHCLVLVLEPVQQGNWVTVKRPGRGKKTPLFRFDQNIKHILPVTHPLRNLTKVL